MIEYHGVRFSQNADFLIVTKMIFSHCSMTELFGKRIAFILPRIYRLTPIFRDT